ncbi:hypothetical protein BDE02_10G028600 [Populus trichocarpa]|nr:hypothetical protein BDE02_10G028600 [Populus trichocarpa]
MGVYSDGSCGIQPGLVYSFPVTCEKGKWSIVQGIKSGYHCYHRTVRFDYCIV